MFQTYLNNLSEQGKAQSTIEEYRFRLNKFLKHLNNKQLDYLEISAKDFLIYRSELMNQGTSISRINNIFSTVRGFYDYLIIEGIIEINPVANSLKMQSKRAKIERLTDEQITHFKSYIDTLKPNIRASFYLMLGTGARVSEVANLKKTDFRFENGYLYIDIKDAKWQSDRHIPIIDEYSQKIVYEYLQSIDITSLPAFRVSKRTIQTYATKFSKQTGIPFHCHLLRHTFASKLLEQDIPIQKISYFLGHKNLNMTAHYTQGAHLDVTQIKATIWQGKEDAI